MGVLKKLAAFLAGRWQIPLAALALVSGGLALHALRPAAPPPVDFPAVVRDLQTLAATGDVVGAGDAAANLLTPASPLKPAERAQLHDFVANLIYRSESARTVPNEKNLRTLLEHHEAAAQAGRTPAPENALRAAYAHRALGAEEQAVAAYRAALEQPLPPDLRRTASQVLVEMLADQPGARLERHKLIEGLLGDEGVSAGYVWWALQQAAEEALDNGDVAHARELLTQYGQRFQTSDLKGYGEYLNAWALLADGRPDEADPLVRWVDAWLESEPRTVREFDEFGYLPTMNRWLAGCVDLALQRPQEALAAFEQVRFQEPLGERFVAASLGKAQALARLGDHTGALAAIREALQRRPGDPPARRRAAERIARVARRIFDDLETAGDCAGGLDYLELVAELNAGADPETRLPLCEKLGSVYLAAADTANSPAVRRTWHARSGYWFDRAAALVRRDEARLAALLWSAAQEFDQAGQTEDVRRTLQQFLEGRSEHLRMPRALLQLGQACEVMGELAPALNWYGQLIERYPKLDEASRARVLSAGCLISLGPEHFAEAERSLTEQLADENITPGAAVFRDASQVLCELLYHQGRYAEAISRLEDFLARYPDDAERLRTRFTLADAYRRSALALRAEPPARVDVESIADEVRGRLRRAAELFDELVISAPPGDPSDPAPELYKRLALFYSADCRFELSDPPSLQEALDIYRNAAAQYEGHPAALIAQVQIANIHLRLGNQPEAARAVERARWLLRSMTDEALRQSDVPTDRRGWDAYLSAVSSASVFREALPAAR